MEPSLPNSAGDATPSVAACIHCGFCLPDCPTYDLLGNELDSPRGRLMLMQQLADGRIDPTAGVIDHLDACLGCLACETACPSGVPYGVHLEQARAELRCDPLRDAGRRRTEALLLAAVALPLPVLRFAGGMLALLRLLGLAALASWLLPGRPGAAAGLLAACRPRGRPPPQRTPPAVREHAPGRSGDHPPRVGLLSGCVGSALFPGVNGAAARLLSSAGCEVLVPRGQVCCGALHLHSGDRIGAARLMRRNLQAFERLGPLDAVVVTAAGCGSGLSQAGRLLADDELWAERARVFSGKVKDTLQLLDELGLPPLPHPLNARLACHDACHLAHAQKLPGLAARLLSRVAGLNLLPLAQADRCCGSAGIHNLLQPEAAGGLASAKRKRVAEAGAELLSAANPGCLLHLSASARAAGSPLLALHPLLLLDQAAHDIRHT